MGCGRRSWNQITLGWDSGGDIWTRDMMEREDYIHRELEKEEQAESRGGTLSREEATGPHRGGLCLTLRVLGSSRTLRFSCDELC